MTRTEVKNRIVKIIDSLPDKSLEAIYEIFQKAEKDKGKALDSGLAKILSQDSDVLSRLAK